MSTTRAAHAVQLAGLVTVAWSLGFAPGCTSSVPPPPRDPSSDAGGPLIEAGPPSPDPTPTPRHSRPAVGGSGTFADVRRAHVDDAEGLRPHAVLGDVHGLDHL